MTTRRPSKPSKPVKRRNSPKPSRVPKRDARGRFVSKRSNGTAKGGDTNVKPPGKHRGAVRGSRPPHPLAGQIVVNHLSGEVYKYDHGGRLRDDHGRFIKRHAEPLPESDGRVRTERMTFDEALQFYEFETTQLPDWVFYLAGSP